MTSRWGRRGLAQRHPPTASAWLVATARGGRGVGFGCASRPGRGPGGERDVVTYATTPPIHARVGGGGSGRAGVSPSRTGGRAGESGRNGVPSLFTRAAPRPSAAWPRATAIACRWRDGRQGTPLLRDGSKVAPLCAVEVGWRSNPSGPRRGACDERLRRPAPTPLFLRECGEYVGCLHGGLVPVGDDPAVGATPTHLLRAPRPRRRLS